MVLDDQVTGRKPGTGLIRLARVPGYCNLVVRCYVAKVFNH